MDKDFPGKYGNIRALRIKNLRSVNFLDLPGSFVFNTAVVHVIKKIRNLKGMKKDESQ